MNILFLSRFGRQGASSRLRILQFLPWFESNAIEYSVSPLFNDSTLIKKYERGGYGFFDLLKSYIWRVRVLMTASKYNLLWIEKEALPWFPLWIEKSLLRGRPYILDFDDAIFHNYDRHRFAWVRSTFGRRIDSLMAGASLITAGNRYLAHRAIAAGAKEVKVVPTVIDLFAYSAKTNYITNATPRIVWVGSPSTAQYLMDLAPALAALSKVQTFILRVVGGGGIVMPGVEVEVMAWSVTTEAKVIAECDIGIMPLRDTPWEQGKCAYKLIQYMACGLPTVSSPVGANRDVVIEMSTGLFADTTKEWVAALTLLLGDESLRGNLGRAGRMRVEAEYSLQTVAPCLISAFKNATA